MNNNLSKKRRVALFVAIMMCLNLAPAAFAETAENDWSDPVSAKLEDRISKSAAKNDAPANDDKSDNADADNAETSDKTSDSSDKTSDSSDKTDDGADKTANADTEKNDTAVKNDKKTGSASGSTGSSDVKAEADAETESSSEIVDQESGVFSNAVTRNSDTSLGGSMALLAATPLEGDVGDVLTLYYSYPVRDVTCGRCGYKHTFYATSSDGEFVSSNENIVSDRSSNTTQYGTTGYINALRGGVASYTLNVDLYFKSLYGQCHNLCGSVISLAAASASRSKEWNITVYETFTINYDANGGTLTGPASEQQRVAQDYYEFTTSDPIREGYIFKGWNRSLTLTHDADGANPTVTVSAVWEEGNTPTPTPVTNHNVKFNREYYIDGVKIATVSTGGNGTAYCEGTVLTAETINAEHPKWLTYKMDGETFTFTLDETASGLPCTVDSDITITLKYVNNNNYKVTYTDGVENEVVFEDQSYDVKIGDKTPSFNGTPTRPNYNFIGWAPDLEPNVKLDDVTNGQIIYTAQWKKQPYKPTDIEQLANVYVKLYCENRVEEHSADKVKVTSENSSFGDIITENGESRIYLNVDLEKLVNEYNTALNLDHNHYAAAENYAVEFKWNEEKEEWEYVRPASAAFAMNMQLFTSITVNPSLPIKEDIEIDIPVKEPKVTYNYVDEQGNVIYSAEQSVFEVNVPKFVGTLPVKDADNEYTYSFSAWNQGELVKNEIGPDFTVTLTPIFDKTPKATPTPTPDETKNPSTQNPTAEPSAVPSTEPSGNPSATPSTEPSKKDTEYCVIHKYYSDENLENLADSYTESLSGKVGDVINVLNVPHRTTHEGVEYVAVDTAAIPQLSLTLTESSADNTIILKYKPATAPTAEPTTVPTTEPTAEPTTIPTTEPTQTPEKADAEYFIKHVYRTNYSDSVVIDGEYVEKFTGKVGDVIDVFSVATIKTYNGKEYISIATSTIPQPKLTLSDVSEDNVITLYYGRKADVVEPTTVPTAESTTVPTTEPTAEPTVVPTAEPTTVPTAEPTTVPTNTPNGGNSGTSTTVPTVVPTAEPTTVPTAEPTTAPTAEPTTEPTAAPTAEPTTEPTAEPTTVPTAVPTNTPNGGNSGTSTTVPTTEPTAEPTVAPTAEPTTVPTTEPTAEPTTVPTTEPTAEPTTVPTAVPTNTPNGGNSGTSTTVPTTVPTGTPSTEPTTPAVPTTSPVVGTDAPVDPANTTEPTIDPSTAPTADPSVSPSAEPTNTPVPTPTRRPSRGGSAVAGNGRGNGTTNINDNEVPLSNGEDATNIDDNEVPLAVAPGLNSEDHFAYIQGYEDGTVRPEANITRAEVATIFFRLMDDDMRGSNKTSDNNFTDVSAGDWFNTAVSTDANAGLIAGRDNGSFDPNANITRAEFAAIAARFLSKDVVVADSFDDIKGHWAEDEINRAVKAGWIRGKDSKTFAPDANITRAEVMTIVNRMLDRVGDSAEMLDSMIKWPDNPESAWYYADVQEATNSHNYERDEMGISETWTELTSAPDFADMEN